MAQPHQGDDDTAFIQSLAELGATDFYAQPLPFANGQIGYATFVTQAPGGFSEATLALLEGIRPFRVGASSSSPLTTSRAPCSRFTSVKTRRAACLPGNSNAAAAC